MTKNGIPANAHNKVVAGENAKAANEMSSVKDYLTWDEFMAFYNHQFDEYDKNLELARDIFCFACATSLRNRDLEALSKTCFDTPDDPTSFTFVCKKTGENTKIYLNEWSKSIYMKYKDMPTQNGLLFPPKSECEMNRCLKKIAKMLWGDHRLDAINTHTARRTFFGDGNGSVSKG
jgi:integrase